MKNVTNHKSWFEGLSSSGTDTPQIIIGYGSLLSKYSRQKYSDISSQPLPVLVRGWERGWITRSIGEKQTYVGAVKNSNKYLNAQAFQTCINERLLAREKDYRFTQLTTDNLVFQSTLDETPLRILSKCKIYICETLDENLPDELFPVNTSYIHTCLKGCFEVGGQEEVERFINTTNYWPKEHRYHDKSKHKYPRAALLEEKEALFFEQVEQLAHKKQDCKVML